MLPLPRKYSVSQKSEEHYENFKISMKILLLQNSKVLWSITLKEGPPSLLALESFLTHLWFRKFRANSVAFVDFTLQPKKHCLILRVSHICLDFQHTVVSSMPMSLWEKKCFQKHLKLFSSDIYTNFIN